MYSYTQVVYFFSYFGEICTARRDVNMRASLETEGEKKKKKKKKKDLLFFHRGPGFQHPKSVLPDSIVE